MLTMLKNGEIDSIVIRINRVISMIRGSYNNYDTQLDFLSSFFMYDKEQPLELALK